jgi:hypothetical protein
MMTEDEHITLVEVGDKFWLEFSDLCNRYLAMAPPHLRDEYDEYLSQKTSWYGRKT